MKPILFATGNADKFRNAETVLGFGGLLIEQVRIDVDEIQGEDPVEILKDKSRKAYEQVNKAILVSDDSWDIIGLKGFPGPYMKSVSHYFTAENFLDLTRNLSDKTVYLHQRLAYNDGHEIVIFTHDTKALIVDESRGDHTISWMKVVTLDGDEGLTLAEVVNQKKDILVTRKAQSKIYNDFVDWYRKVHS